MFLPGHRGPHSQAYHEGVLDHLTKALDGVRGKKNRAAALEKGLKELAEKIRGGDLSLN